MLISKRWNRLLTFVPSFLFGNLPASFLLDVSGTAVSKHKGSLSRGQRKFRLRSSPKNCPVVPWVWGFPVPLCKVLGVYPWCMLSCGLGVHQHWIYLSGQWCSFNPFFIVCKFWYYDRWKPLTLHLPFFQYLAPILAQSFVIHGSCDMPKISRQFLWNAFPSSSNQEPCKQEIAWSNLWGLCSDCQNDQYWHQNGSHSQAVKTFKISSFLQSFYLQCNPKCGMLDYEKLHMAQRTGLSRKQPLPSCQES